MARKSEREIVELRMGPQGYDEELNHHSAPRPM
jgi:hypothetical protein